MAADDIGCKPPTPSEEVTDPMKIRAYRLMCSTTAVSALVALLAAPKKW
jgi:hypothetical protein